MMPMISEDSRNNSAIDYKQIYRNLKRKLKLLIYENECYQEELKKNQRQLLQVARDKNFLLDRLMNYEDLNSITSDSDATDISDSEVERKLDIPIPAKRKKSESLSDTGVGSNHSSKKKKTTSRSISPTIPSFSSLKAKNSSQIKPVRSNSNTNNLKPITSTIKPFSCSFSSQTENHSLLGPITSSSINDVALTSEQIEKHFESRSLPPSLLMPEKTPLTVPMELFSNESSHESPESENRQSRLND